MDKYLNPELSPEVRAADLLAKMSLDEKMAQVSCIFPFEGNWEQVVEDAKHGIGQVSYLDVRDIDNLHKVSEWQRKIQKMVMEKSEHHIPAVFHMEGLCGAFIQDATSFPSGIGRGSSWNPALEKKIAEIISRQELSCGFTQILAPVLDVSREPRMGRQGETYGEDPTLAAAMGTAYAKGIQDDRGAGRKADSTAKHFLGFHSSQGGIHGADCNIPGRLLMEVYAKPFQAAVTEADMHGIMPCYCSINGEPASASKKLLTDLLRNDMGFNGVAVSDYCAISNVYSAQKVTESAAEAGLLAMQAGMDVEMPNCVGFNEELKERFRTGEADIQILDRAVTRVLEAKFRMGMFENPFALTGKELEAAFYNEEDINVSLQSALESMVLLKNNGVLPLSKNVKKIAVVGCHAKNARSFFGSYTHLSMVEAIRAVANSMAGIKSGSTEGKKMLTVPGTQIQSDETDEFDAILRTQKPECKSLLQMLKQQLPDVDISYAYGYAIAGDDLTHFDEALEIVKDADVVIMTLGGKYGSCSVASMGEGIDAANINLPVCQDEFIRRASELGKPMVGVHFDGRPISSDTADTYLDAVLEAWNPSEMGAKAITQVLTGKYNPGGKLPVCVARSAGQVPIYYNHPNGSAWHQGDSIGFPDYVDMPHTPRYFFGHGLSYTTFAYSDLKLSGNKIKPHEQIQIALDVENTGSIAGEEVVQLYIKDVQASMTRPVKELAGFLRLRLEPGQKKTVTFVMQASQVAFLDREMKWKVEKGEIEVQLGSSSEDIHLKDSFVITDDAWIEGRHRAFYAMAKA